MTKKFLNVNMPQNEGRGLCMKGNVRYRKDRGYWVVDWYDSSIGRGREIAYYKGERIYHQKLAQKLLSVMQSDFENGTFRIEKYSGKGWTDVVPYMEEWIEEVKPTLAPATYKDYKNSIKNHLKPFFMKHKFQLHEIQYDILVKLLNEINRVGKGKFNVMMVLHACLKFAKRSRRIAVMPEFPEKRLYRMEKKPVDWLSSETQEKVINAIPKEHQPFFWFLKYHWRRPGEAMAIHIEDYDEDKDCFIIRRGISSRKVVNFTKTRKIHVIPCHSEFKPYLKQAIKDRIENELFSPYLFTCKSSRKKGKRYTDTIYRKIWYAACDKVGIKHIWPYHGTKTSSASQFMNELHGNRSELQVGGDWADIRSTESYAQAELSTKREILERGSNVIKLSERKKA